MSTGLRWMIGVNLSRVVVVVEAIAEGMAGLDDAIGGDGGGMWI